MSFVVFETPTLMEWISVIGVGVSIWAALGARGKARAVHASIVTTKDQLLRSDFRNEVENLRRLAERLDAAALKNKGLTRYLLLDIAETSTRCSTLVKRSIIPDRTSLAGELTLSELLESASGNAQRAKNALYASTEKLQEATSELRIKLDALRPELVHISTLMKHEMDGNVHERRMGKGSEGNAVSNEKQKSSLGEAIRQEGV